ncbi:hypothetical protein ABEB36_002764 [Hypothenemus hampei]|uniref:Uncharacterized protein n=1 Tax=Hypothenemus hampei TaxID=57062 RepID=A0ABD1F793_HYPHA
MLDAAPVLAIMKRNKEDPKERRGINFIDLLSKTFSAVIQELLSDKYSPSEFQLIADVANQLPTHSSSYKKLLKNSVNLTYLLVFLCFVDLRKVIDRVLISSDVVDKVIKAKIPKTSPLYVYKNLTTRQIINKPLMSEIKETSGIQEESHSA